MTAGFGNKMDLQKVLANKSWMSVLAPPMSHQVCSVSSKCAPASPAAQASTSPGYLGQPIGSRPVTSTQEFLAQLNGNRVQFAPVPRNISKAFAS
jgi:hypothetical protein